ncbi:Uncharacterised protein [Shigella sonnei]|nr:Uncharacterised protein [Shigella sonnei]
MFVGHQKQAAKVSGQFQTGIVTYCQSGNTVFQRIHRRSERRFAFQQRKPFSHLRTGDLRQLFIVQFTGEQLRQLRCTDVDGQHVGVTVFAQRTRLAAFIWIVPCPFVNSCHAGCIAVRNHCPCQHLTASVKDAYHITVTNTARAGILRVNEYWLFTRYRILLTQSFRLT